ncbi:hypothetical protein HWC08_gp065 [Lactobacillus phage 521B]|uniref:Uncharacterized protein n=1 Tax=Lactobacillus phage 521B TaxID=2510942 RepID=A0A4Y5FEF3_9CAUD|nr:hypothetical protein HWC08_gp065 [Lactobacillus phage 521B]QBJ03415.1 hypothetical protein B521_0065 [Lactobacillus phage 521B]
MEKVTMDQVVQYIMYVAKKEELPVSGASFTIILYLLCQSLIKEGRLKSKGFYNFYYSGYLSSDYTMYNHLAGIGDYGVFCEPKNVLDLEDKYISIFSNLCVNPFTILEAIEDKSYLMNEVYSGKIITIGYSELEKEYFSSEINSDCEYKVDLTVTFKAPWYLSKEINYDRVKESIINSIKEGNMSISSLTTKEIEG